MADFMQKREPPVQPDHHSLDNSQPSNLSQPASLGPQMTPLSSNTTEDFNALKASQANMFKLQRGRSK